MLKLLLGDPNTRKLKRYQPIVEEINLLEEEVSILTDDELRNETNILKAKVSSELDIKRQKQQLEELRYIPNRYQYHQGNSATEGFSLQKPRLDPLQCNS